MRWLTARDNSHHLRSAHLAEQAGHAFLEAGHADKAALYARQAVQRFIAACPQCGGPLCAEVDWMDSALAECSYCGSGVLTEPL